ncbi:MAG: transcription antitermination factor NusB [Chloroflexi bacterium]|nr:transcription antitermination factor NusB [Chloroflexota bacterium]
MVASRRRQGRMIALQALFEVDAVSHAPESVLERLIEERDTPEDVASFARHLVSGVMEHRSQIDKAIQDSAPLWPVEQLATIDRSILRLALYELMFNQKVPLKAAINEAVELAKAFGSDSSYRFINGVLGNISAQITDTKKGGDT